jgi:tetratricopeptide (TPR) repeat protein/transcriptional regulator with XRE-family HTH domain
MSGKGKQATNHLLRRERELRGWSQQRLANEIETDRFMVSRWERGAKSPSPYFRERLCLLFGKTAEELGFIQSLNTQPPLQVAPASGQIWNVPFRRNPFFTGREEVIQCLHAHLQTDKRAVLTQAITGLGGVGKTQTVLEYAYRFRAHYQAVLWISAEIREQFFADLAALTHVLELPERAQTNQQRIAAVQRWLKEHTGWLLILDNLEDPGLVEQWLPDGPGQVVITTRLQATGTLATPVELAVMPSAEGIAFLLRRTKLLSPETPLEGVPEAERSQAEAIVTLLGGLPLALDQAGAYIEETGCSLGDYLNRFSYQQSILLQRRGKLALDHPAPVSTTFALAFGQAERTSKAAADMLRLCAFLSPDAIPEEILVKGAAHLGPTLEAVVASSVELDLAIAVLRSFSLVNRQPQMHSLSLHRLVQTVVRESMDAETARQWRERAVYAVNAAFPSVEFANWQQCERLISHARLCLPLMKQEEMNTVEAAELFYKTGCYLFERVSYTEAEPYHRQALIIAERCLGAEHLTVADILEKLAQVLIQQAKSKEARPLCERVLHIRTQNLGSDHLLTAETLNNLGELYWKQGDYVQAEALCRQVLSIREQQLGPEHPDTIDCFNNLAWISWRLGKYAQAEYLASQVLTLNEQKLGASHPLLATHLATLISIYQSLGKYTQALSAGQRALAICEQHFGPDHQRVRFVLDGLTSVYLSMENYAQAEALSLRALTIQAPDGRPVMALNNLASVYVGQGKYEQAEPLYREALMRWEKVMGPTHIRVAEVVRNLASLFLMQGRYEESESFYQRALDIHVQSLGKSHPETAKVLAGLAELSRQQGKQQLALELYHQVLLVYGEHLGQEHPETIQIKTRYTLLQAGEKRKKPASSS